MSVALDFISTTQLHSRVQGDGGNMRAAFKSSFPEAKIPLSQTRGILLLHTAMGSLAGPCLGQEWGNSRQKSPKGLALDTSSKCSWHTPVCHTWSSTQPWHHKPQISSWSQPQDKPPSCKKLIQVSPPWWATVSWCQPHSAPQGHGQCLPMGPKA